jgi:hypothetical protein
VVASLGIWKKKDLEVGSLVETISPETCFVLKRSLKERKINIESAVNSKRI